MTIYRDSASTLTASLLLRESAEMSLGIEPLDMAARSMDTPLISGRLIMHEVQPGLIATASDITYLSNEPFDVEIDASLLCSVLLDGTEEEMQVGEWGPVRKCLERPVLVGFDDRVACHRTLPAPYRCRDAGFVLKPLFFERFGHELVDEGLQMLHELMTDGFQTRTLARSAQVLEIARQLLDHPYNGHLGTLFLESSALNLVVGIVDLLRREEHDIGRLGARHYRRVLEARDILDHQLVAPPSTMELARQVGVNISTLQANFKQVFQTTIFGYVRDQRLKMARVLLLEHGLPASEAGRKVGFSSPSAFAAAYRRHFGHSPTSERGQI